MKLFFSTMKSSENKNFTKLFFIAVIGFVFFVGYIRYLEATVIFHPARQVVMTPKEMKLDYEDVYFLTEDHLRLNGWLIKNPQAKSTVIFFHGNSGNMGDRLGKVGFLHQLGLNVFIIDYRGYGKSEGKPTELGIYQDARAAYDYLLTRPDINPRRIIVYGVSLGGAPAIDLAVQRKLAGLIIDASFSSGADMAHVLYPFIPSFLLNIKFDSLKKIKSVAAPKLFIHSMEDETVHYRLGKKLYDAASSPKSFLKIKGTHNEAYLESREVYLAGIRNFLNIHQL